jgi:hypothetical protein
MLEYSILNYEGNHNREGRWVLMTENGETSTVEEVETYAFDGSPRDKASILKVLSKLSEQGWELVAPRSKGDSYILKRGK